MSIHVRQGLLDHSKQSSLYILVETPVARWQLNVYLDTAPLAKPVNIGADGVGKSELAQQRRMQKSRQRAYIPCGFPG